MTDVFVTINDVQHSCPTYKEVCPKCLGEGRYVNPSIGAISAERFQEWEPEEREHYFNGGYDVLCEVCKGRNVVDVPDVGMLGEELEQQYKEEQEELAQEAIYDRALYRAEMGMGA